MPPQTRPESSTLPTAPEHGAGAFRRREACNYVTMIALIVVLADVLPMMVVCLLIHCPRRRGRRRGPHVRLSPPEPRIETAPSSARPPGNVVRSSTTIRWEYRLSAIPTSPLQGGCPTQLDRLMRPSPMRYFHRRAAVSRAPRWARYRPARSSDGSSCAACCHWGRVRPGSGYGKRGRRAVANWSSSRASASSPRGYRRLLAMRVR